MPVTARWFRIISFIEAVTWTALLIAMFLKWVVHAPHEGGVPVVGMVHGIGFVVYLLSTIVAAVQLRWSWGIALLGMVAGIPPFGTVVFERRMHRSGRLWSVNHPARAASRRASPEPQSTRSH